MIRALFTATTACLLSASAADAKITVHGPKPKLDVRLASVPNEQAIVRAFWFPGIDAGFVPQGLTTAGAHVLVAGYHDKGQKAARVWRMNMTTGKVEGEFALPREVKHAGGLAYDGRKYLYATDKGLVYRIELAAALRFGCGFGACQRIKLAAPLGGSFAAWDRARQRLWVGRWVDDLGKGKPDTCFGVPNGARIYRTEPAKKTELGTQGTHSLPVARGIQGAALAPNGHLWLSGSDSRYGLLRVVDPTTGAGKTCYRVTPGIEDLSFSNGLLWTVSEAGVRKYKKWKTRFPVVFALDVAKLR